MGIDTVALVSMSGALAFGQEFASAIVALMYTGGSLLEDYDVARAQRDFTALIDRAPRVAHRLTDIHGEDIAADGVAIGDAILVRAGEIVPVDGVLTTGLASIGEAVLTGEPLPVHHRLGENIRSGALNAGEAFHMEVPSTGAPALRPESCAW
jgi:P-type E1-E2 ATPase